MAKNVFLRFGDVSSFVKYLDTQPNSTIFKGKDLSSESSSESFSGTRSYADAQKLLSYGDADNAHKILNENGICVKKHSRYADGNVLRLKADIVGYLPYVPAYNSGLPFDMLNKHHVRMRKKVVSVYLNMSASCDNSKEAINAAALKVINAVLDAEKMGVRVNLYSGGLAKKNGSYCGFAVRIKSSSQYMDKLKMAYPLCNPSFLRRHYFRFVEKAEGIDEGFTSGYGYPLSAADTIDFFKKNVKDKEMNFDCVISIQDMVSDKDGQKNLAEMFVSAAV